jgi:hypothetical protein
MDEGSVRDLLGGIADDTPARTRVDSALAVRTARHRRRQTWTMAGAAALVTLVIVAVAVAVGINGRRPAPVIAPPQVVPSRFDPLQHRLEAGWLPAHGPTTTHEVSTRLESISGLTPGSATYELQIYLAAAHQQLPARGRSTNGRPVAGPDINGVASRWYPGARTGIGNGGRLVWQWGKYAQAAIDIRGDDQQDVAAKIARHLRTDRITPVRTPFQVTPPRGTSVCGSLGVEYRPGSDPADVSYSVGLNFGHCLAGDPAVTTAAATWLSIQVVPLRTTGISFTGKTTVGGKPADVFAADRVATVRLKPYESAILEIKADSLLAAGPSGPTPPAQLKRLAVDLAGTVQVVGDVLDPRTWSTHPVR